VGGPGAGAVFVSLSAAAGPLACYRASLLAVAAAICFAFLALLIWVLAASITLLTRGSVPGTVIAGEETAAVPPTI